MNPDLFQKIVGPDERFNALEAAAATILKRHPDARPEEVLGLAFWDTVYLGCDALNAACSKIAMDHSLLNKDAAIADEMADFKKYFEEFIPAGIGKALAAETLEKTSNLEVRRPWREHRTDTEEAARRASSARENLSHPYDPAPEDDEQETKMPTRKSLYSEMDNIAKAARRPDETHAIAYARCLESDPDMRKLYIEARNSAPDVSAAVPASIAKREPSDAGYQGIVAAASELLKSEPKLTRSQAFAKAYCDPQNARFVKAHRAIVEANLVAANL